MPPLITRSNVLDTYKRLFLYRKFLGKSQLILPTIIFKLTLQQPTALSGFASFILCFGVKSTERYLPREISIWR